MSRTDKTFIDEKGNLRVRTTTVRGTRVSAPDKLSTQTLVDTPNGPELVEKTTSDVQIADIPGLQDKLDALDASDDSLQMQITAANEAIANEKIARQSADANLQTQIDNTNSALVNETTRAKTRENQIEQNLNTEIVARGDADADLDSRKIEKSVVPTVMTDFGLTSGATSATLIKTLTDTDTGDSIDTNIPLPIATESNVGLVHPAVIQTVSDNASRISLLEGASKRYPVRLGTDPLTQAQYQTAWETAAGVPTGTIPPDGSTLVNLDNNHVITYFENATIDKWVDRGADTVSVADNDGVQGVVTGSLEDGQIFIETNGQMSVNGVDAQNAAIANNASNISNVATNLSDHITDNQRHITPAERANWNAKAPADSPELTGTPTTPTPTNDSPDDQIANKEYVLNNGHFARIDDLGILQEEQSIVLNKKSITLLTSDDSVPESTLNLTLPDTAPTEVWTFQIRIKTGEVIPSLIWDDGIKWVNNSTNQIEDPNKTSIFVIEKFGSDIIGNYAGSY